jgi:plasmid stability protein
MSPKRFWISSGNAPARAGESVEAEARQILNDVVWPDTAMAWARINAFREQLAASGREFGDSAREIREDRDR